MLLLAPWSRTPTRKYLTIQLRSAILPCTAAAKRVYRKLSILVHPDRCAHASAQDAFAAASQAMHIVAERAAELEVAADAELAGGQAARGGGGEDGEDGVAVAAAAPGGDGAAAVIPYQDIEELLRQVVWNQNRLAVQAVQVPPDELAACGLLHPAYQQQFAPGSSLAGEPLLFLPMAAIPTLKKRKRHGSVAAAAAAAGAAAAAAMLHAPPPVAAAPAPAAAAVGAGATAPEPDQAGSAVMPGVAGDDSSRDAPSGQPAGAAVSASMEAAGEGEAGEAGGGDAVVVAEDEELPGRADAAPGEPCAAAAPAEPADAAAGEPGEVPGREAADGASANEREQPQQQRSEALAGARAGRAEEGGEQQQEEEMVDGLLLFSARTALSGRFPLNGTYFQARGGAAPQAQQPARRMCAHAAPRPGQRHSQPPRACCGAAPLPSQSLLLWLPPLWAACR